MKKKIRERMDRLASKGLCDYQRIIARIDQPSTRRYRLETLNVTQPTPSLCFCDPGATRLRPGPGGHSAVNPTAPLSGQHPHDARDSGSSLGAAPWSKFALQRQPCVRQATLEHLATPMPFLTGRFRACVSSSRAAYNGRH